MCSRLFHTFSSVRFSVFGFILRLLIDLDLTFGLVDRYCSISTRLHADIQLNQNHLLKMLSLFHCVFLASFSKIGAHRYSDICLSLQLLWSNSLFLSQHHVVFITVTPYNNYSPDTVMNQIIYIITKCRHSPTSTLCLNSPFSQLPGQKVPQNSNLLLLVTHLFLEVYFSCSPRIYLFSFLIHL